jgi:phosphatidylglycerol---prolipoprotein diacylglyceryl transferase
VAGRALIEIGFDPVLQLGELSVRWQTVGVALALIVCVAMTARALGQGVAGKPLRLDDMAFILLASVPGAVVGGRLVHGLVFWEAYSAQPARLLDPGLGSLSLLGAVSGGVLTGILMAALLRAPTRLWADAAAVPLLMGLGLGKLAQFLGGSGQGAPTTGPWAVAFTGAGPWVSANPALPAHPSQVYEGLWLLLGALVVLGLAQGMRSRLPLGGGVLLIAALAIFMLGRVVVGFSWRDQALLGPLNAEQLLAMITLAVLGMAVLAARWVNAGRARYRGQPQE